MFHLVDCGWSLALFREKGPLSLEQSRNLLTLWISRWDPSLSGSLAESFVLRIRAVHGRKVQENVVVHKNW